MIPACSQERCNRISRNRGSEKRAAGGARRNAPPAERSRLRDRLFAPLISAVRKASPDTGMENREIFRSRCPENSHPIYRVFRAGIAARNFRCRLHLSTILRQSRVGGNSRPQAESMKCLRPALCFFLHERRNPPIGGERGEFVSRQSEAPAERMAVNRQISSISAKGAMSGTSLIAKSWTLLKRYASAASAGLGDTMEVMPFFGFRFLWGLEPKKADVFLLLLLRSF